MFLFLCLFVCFCPIGTSSPFFVGRFEIGSHFVINCGPHTSFNLPTSWNDRYKPTYAAHSQNFIRVFAISLNVVSCSPEIAQATYIHYVVGASLELLILLPHHFWFYAVLALNPGLLTCYAGIPTNRHPQVLFLLSVCPETSSCRLR